MTSFADLMKDLEDPPSRDVSDNYQHRALLVQLQRLYEQMPPGWSKNPYFYGSGIASSSAQQAPFVHADGRTSFQHPNRSVMKALILKTQQEQQTAAIEKENIQHPSAHHQQHRAQIKKLRMMIQAGLPVAVVQQKNQVLGLPVTMDQVLQKDNAPNGTATTSSSTSSSNDKNESCIVPTPLKKKYKRMIKAGVPLQAVQTMARVDGKFTPQQLTAALADVLMDHHHHHPTSSSTTTTVNDNDRSKPCVHCSVALEECSPTTENLHASSSDQKSPTEEDEAGLFIPQKHNNMVAFQSGTPLCSLVRHVVQSVQKIARKERHHNSNGSSKEGMVVDTRTLFHALGALQGVQVARDTYNQTVIMKHGDGHHNAVVLAKRQAFVEMAATIGMTLEENNKTKVDIPGLDPLVAFITTIFAKELAATRDLLDNGWYDFDSLGALYPPGARVVARNAGGGGIDMMCRVVWHRYEQGRTIMGRTMRTFQVCFSFVVAVGASHATVAEVVESMEEFQDKRSLRSPTLMFCPLAAFTANEQTMFLERFRHRGQVYNDVALCGSHVYKAYHKGCFFLKRGGGTASFLHTANAAASLATAGRIIVDTQGAYDHGHSLGVGYESMVMGIKYKYKEYSLYQRSLQKGKEQQIGSQRAPHHAKRHQGDDANGLILFDQVPDDMLEFVWPSVVGFSLTAKAWGDVLVDGLEEIEWQEGIFDRLVLPDNRKQMVKALVRHSCSSSGTEGVKFHDLVPGKGEGTVFLLYGPPGVGKTLTAEAVAELLHKPLYSLSLGALGTTAAELEQRLGQIMTLTAKWNALLLLDEADSFLEARCSASSLERNAMVSVMLKLVEYFSGIMFLTSNRIESLDQAFQTRITLALRYEPLDKTARAKVWDSLLIKSDLQSAIDAGAIVPAKLAEAVLNGREIKNALRLAMAMAAEKGKPLSQAILLETVDIVTDHKATMAQSLGEHEKSRKTTKLKNRVLSWLKQGL